MWLLLLFSFIQLTAEIDSSFTELSKTQAEYYLTNIHHGEDLNENLLLFTILLSENPDLSQHVNAYIKNQEWDDELINRAKNQEGNYKKRLLELVFQTGSADLLIALLLEEKNRAQRIKIKEAYESRFSYPAPFNVNYEKLAEAIIDQQPIPTDILSNDRYHLAHFLILYSSLSTDLFRGEYLNELKENLKTGPSSAKSDLIYTLHQNTFLRILYILDEYSEINKLYNFIMQNNLFPVSSTKLRIYRFMEYSMYRLGYFDRSLNLVREHTLPLSKRFDDKSSVLSIKLYQGIYLYNIGKIQEAVDNYEAILAEADKNNIAVNRTALYNNLGISYWKLGRFDKYLDLQFKALESTKNDNNYSYQLDFYQNLYVYYRSINNEKSALSYLNQARNLADKYGDKSSLSGINLSLGTFYRDFKQDVSTSQKYFSEAEKFVDPENDFILYISILFEKAKLWEQNNKLDQALITYNTISALSKGKNEYRYILALTNQVNIYLEQNNLRKAENLISQINSNNLDQLDFKDITKAKTVEASYLNKTGHPDEALSIMEPVLDQVMERARNSADIQTGYWNVEQEFLDAFDLVVGILIENNRHDEAVETLDRLKTINDAALYQSPLVRARTLNESELTRYKQITDQLDNLRKRLLTASDSNRFSIQQTIEQLKIKKRQYDKRFTKYADQEPIKVRSVQNRLSARDLVLHITELKDQYYIAEITRSDVSFRTITLDDSLRKHLTDATVQVAIHETDLDILYSITKLLKLDSLPDRFENITVIPDTYLYQFPVDILPLEPPQNSYSYGSTSYLIEKYNINYLTSLNDFRREKTDANTVNQHRWSYLGYGVSKFDNRSLVPLPFAGTEVKGIASQLTEFSDNHTFIDDASSKKAFTSSAPHGRILHLATHSEISEQDPLFSTIYMNEEETVNPDDDFSGQVFAYELFELNLDNDMIMLNSCESGSGAYIQGTGIMGISRALRYAGANSLVLNLWSVNDMMASDFAIHFYSELNKGKSKPEALRDTKRHFLKTKNASPHYWGPYMLIGNTDPIVEPYQATNMIMAGTFMLYFMLLSGLSLWVNRKRKISKNKAR